MAYKKIKCTNRNGDKHLYIELFNNKGMRDDFVDSNNKHRPAYAHYWNDIICNEQYYTNGYFANNYDIPNNISYYPNGNIRSIGKNSECINVNIIQSISDVFFDTNGNIISQQYYNGTNDIFGIE